MQTKLKTIKLILNDEKVEKIDKYIKQVKWQFTKSMPLIPPQVYN
jgi:hypothetical protein